MAGRKPLVDSVKPYKPPRKNKPRPYNLKKIEQRGKQKNEGFAIKSFWTEYSMDKVITMTPEELDQAIDSNLDAFIERQFKINKYWNFPETLDYRIFK